MNRRNANDSYNINMSPAARRRALKGKRSANEFNEFKYSANMSDIELIKMWEEEESRDWTKTLPSVMEQDALRREREQKQKQKHRQHRRNGNKENYRGNRNSKNGTVENHTGNRNSKNGAVENYPGNRNSKNKNPKEGRGGTNLHSPGERNQGQRATRKQNNGKRGKVGLMVQLYTLSVLGFFGVLLYINLLPWVFYLPALLIALLFTGLVRLRNKGRRKLGSNFIALCGTGINAIGIYYLMLLVSVLSGISGENNSQISLSKDTFHVYISGIDTYGDIDESSRSDVNLIATINPKTGQSLLTTTPRDYYVEIPGISNGQKDKLTHAGNYGIETSMDTLGGLYNEELDFYVRVNFSSVIDIIDALGGVEVESNISFTTSEKAGAVVEIQEGLNYLNGVESLAFTRERYNLVEGDAQRGRNQQALLKGIINKLASPDMLLNAHKVLQCIGENIETNMSASQLQNFAKALLQGAILTEMQTLEAKGYGDRAYCYSYSSKSLYVTIPYEESVQEIQDEMTAIKEGKVYKKY